MSRSAQQSLVARPGKDVFWYTREKKDDDGSQAAEMLAIKQREEDLMAEVCRFLGALALCTRGRAGCRRKLFQSRAAVLQRTRGWRTARKACVLQALGIKPRTLRPLARAKLDKKDVAQLLSRGEEGEEPDPAAEADRIKGLGFAACGPL